MLIDADRQFEFAEHYFESRQYSRAVDEFKRFVYFFPGDIRVEQAMFNIGMSNFLNRRYSEAVEDFQALIDRFELDALSVKSYFMIGESHMELGAPGAAVIALNNLATVSSGVDVRDEAYYRIGWVYIETASWENARHYFSKISPSNRGKYKLLELSENLDREKSIPGKDPSLAGLLSIVPGGGFAYCERYRDALVAFLLNGALIYAAYEAFDADNPALGAVIGFVEVGFYGGNIYGAVGSAHKYNMEKTGQFIEEIKERHKMKLSAAFGRDRVGVALRYEF